MPKEFDEEENTGQSTFINYTKNLLKVFTLLTIVVLVMALKNRLLGQEATLFYTALFVVAATFLLTILSTLDNYIFSNLVLGIGLALGLKMMDWNNSTAPLVKA